MIDKLNKIKERYKTLEKELSKAEIISDQKKYSEYAKEYSDLEKIVKLYDRYKKCEREIAYARELMEASDDNEMIELAKNELNEITREKEGIEQELKILLIPKDPRDEKNVIVEIRAGAGGDEAALFAGSLYRLYTKYAEMNNWKTEVMSSNPSEIGGFKEIVFGVQGKGAYSRLKYESGVHRVQRIPVTESGGRIHTSTVTVAVLPEAEEVEVDIDPGDLRIDVYRSSGPGGQSVNTTDSAVRVTHIPTGIVVSCQDEKSQHKNKAKALRILRARLLDKAEREQEQKLAETRRTQVGTGDRSERIRTYNYPQNRITDHRIGFTIHKLEDVLEGSIDDIVDALISAEHAASLKELG